MNKTITIPDDIFQELKSMAARQRQPIKNYIEAMLIRKVESERKKLKPKGGKI